MTRRPPDHERIVLVNVPVPVAVPVPVPAIARTPDRVRARSVLAR